ncbi:MAG TPA: septum formation initiator family protein [Chloroflexota bacterium]|nr:septum formation initiator family protein [Chloroflexota bacterium]
MREIHVGGRGVPPGLWLGILALACVLLLIQTAQRAVASYQMAREVDAARKELAEVKQRNLDLQAQITKYRSDTYVEKVAREELNMVRPGDVPVIVLAPTPAAPPVGTPRPTATPVVSVPEQWLRHFVDEP